MSRRSSSGLPVRTWSGDEHAWPDDPVARGPLRISGTVLGGGASWYVTTDRLGWSTVALLSDPGGLGDWDAGAVLRRCAETTCEPVQTALAIRDRLREHSPARCRRAGLAVARIGPFGRLIELVNGSLPTVLHWDPVEGLSPYEPVFPSLDAMTAAASSEMLRLRSGAALVLTTAGVLPDEAGWSELRGFARAIGLDPLGGTVADAPPSELRRLLCTFWGRSAAPAGVVVIGLPSFVQQVA
jgi:hypothetical protein